MTDLPSAFQAELFLRIAAGLVGWPLLVGLVGWLWWRVTGYEVEAEQAGAQEAMYLNQSDVRERFGRSDTPRLEAGGL